MAYKKKEKIENVSGIVVSTPACASFFDISERGLRKWKSKGCPAQGHGLWNLQDVFRWWQENIMESKTEEKDPEIAGVKFDYWSARARQENVKADAAEGRYIAKADLKVEWLKRSSLYRSGMLAMSSRLPPLLLGKSEVEMRSVLHSEACLILSALSQDHEFCPADSLPDEYLELRIIKKDKETGCKSKQPAKRSQKKSTSKAKKSSQKKKSA